MGRMRKSYTESFKRKVAIEAIREKKTVAEIAAESGVAPSLVTEWKQRFINYEDSKEVRHRNRRIAGNAEDDDNSPSFDLDVDYFLGVERRIRSQPDAP